MKTLIEGSLTIHDIHKIRKACKECKEDTITIKVSQMEDIILIIDELAEELEFTKKQRRSENQPIQLKNLSNLKNPE